MRTVDLFCGCGGLSLGFEKSGFEIIGSYDFWDAAIHTYNNNFNHHAKLLDLSQINIVLTEIAPLHPDLIIGGPPCQDFSSAGGRQEGERANLTISFAKIVEGIHPQYFIMENVSRARKSQAYAEAKKIFKASNYGLTELVLDASRCGVPQKRKRFFCIGALNRDDDFLKNILLDHQSVIPLTVREYFTQNNLPLNFDYYYRHPRTYSRRAIYSVDEPSPTIRGVNRPRPSTYLRHPNDAAFSPEIRSLTHQERALIQTFPPNFYFGNSLAVAEQMIGNAVPVNLASHVAKALLAFDQQKSSYANNFSVWLSTHYSFSRLAIKDILSRINRCHKISPINTRNLKDYIATIENLEYFVCLSPSVRSQLKRALILYDEYLQSM